MNEVLRQDKQLFVKINMKNLNLDLIQGVTNFPVITIVSTHD